MGLAASWNPIVYITFDSHSEINSAIVELDSHWRLFTKRRFVTEAVETCDKARRTHLDCDPGVREQRW